MNTPRKGKQKDKPKFVPIKADLDDAIGTVKRAIEQLLYTDFESSIVPLRITNEVRRILNLAADVAHLAFKPLEDYQATLGETRDHA